jgi:hypothetical protein
MHDGGVDQGTHRGYAQEPRQRVRMPLAASERDVVVERVVDHRADREAADRGRGGRHAQPLHQQDEHGIVPGGADGTHTREDDELLKSWRH